MNPERLHGMLLAASDIWSELFSTLLILLFIAVPAIIRVISEAQNRQKQRRNGKKIEDVSKQKIGPQGLRPAQKGTRRPRGPLSEWDRRQQQIRERMNKLKEQAEAHVQARQHRPPRPPAKSREEILPVAKALPEQPEHVVHQAPKPPAYKPNKPDGARLPDKMRQYMQAVAAPSTTKRRPSPPRRAKSTMQTKLVSPGKASQEKINPAIERIFRSSNPLQAGIILKEILDRPKSLRFDSDI